MKIRLTIMTENDKHLPEGFDKAEFQDTAKNAWEQILYKLGGPGDKATVEQVEIVEA